MPEEIASLLPILIPLVVIQLGLMIWALYDMTRPDRKVRGDNKVVWALIVIFINIIGPVLYLFVGREEE
jgi:hypothetical protein